MWTCHRHCRTHHLLERKRQSAWCLTLHEPGKLHQRFSSCYDVIGGYCFALCSMNVELMWEQQDLGVAPYLVPGQVAVWEISSLSYYRKD
jgi:hypothetical protein